MAIVRKYIPLWQVYGLVEQLTKPRKDFVTGYRPEWMAGVYVVPRPSIVTDSTIALVYDCIQIWKDGLLLSEPEDYKITSHMFQVIFVPTIDQQWPVSSIIQVSYRVTWPWDSPPEPAPTA